MSREDIVAIASRLFAVFLFVSVLRFAASSFASIETFSSLGHMALFLAAICLPTLAIAALLWYFPLSVARKLLPVMKEPKPVVDHASRTALQLALTAIGFWVLANAVTDLAYWIVFVTRLAALPTPVEQSPETTAGIVATIVETLLGLWLILGNQGLVNLIERLKYSRNPLGGA